MRIEFYRTILCPRCLYVDRVLKKICARNPDLAVERIEITTNLSRAVEAGIRTVPTLRIGNDRLCGLFPGQRAIEAFINRHRQEEA